VVKREKSFPDPERILAKVRVTVTTSVPAGRGAVMDVVGSSGGTDGDLTAGGAGVKDLPALIRAAISKSSWKVASVSEVKTSVGFFLFITTVTLVLSLLTGSTHTPVNVPQEMRLSPLLASI
jgi:hypothetical protein